MEQNIKINKCIHDRDKSYEIVCYNNEYNKDNTVIMYCAEIIISDTIIFLYNKHNDYIGFIDKKAVSNMEDIE